MQVGAGEGPGTARAVVPGCWPLARRSNSSGAHRLIGWTVAAAVVVVVVVVRVVEIDV
jgi:hypothetical protein